MSDTQENIPSRELMEHELVPESLGKVATTTVENNKQLFVNRLLII